MTTPIFHTRRSTRAHWLGVALATALSAAVLSACGAKAEDGTSTDTGNPPVIDEQKLRIAAGDDGVVVIGDPGAVDADANVTVTNERSGASSATTASSDGSFEVAVEGTLEDSFEVEVEVGGDVATVTVDSNGATPSSGLVGRTFLLDSSEGFTPVENTTVRLWFEEAEFGFSAGCNSHFGNYTLCDDKLCSEGLGSTAIGCQADLSMQDEFLAAFFGSTPTLELEGDGLTVTGDDATLSFLDLEVADPDRPLTGRVWTIDTLITGDAASNVPVAAPPTVEFRDDGTVRVFDTCNTGGGNYVVDTGTEGPSIGSIVLDSVAYTEEGCGPSGNESVAEHVQEVMSEGTLDFEIQTARLTLQRDDLGVGATTE